VKILLKVALKKETNRNDLFMADEWSVRFVIPSVLRSGVQERRNGEKRSISGGEEERRREARDEDFF
jgi:hypothetical protein